MFEHAEGYGTSMGHGWFAQVSCTAHATDRKDIRVWMCRWIDINIARPSINMSHMVVVAK